MIDPYSLSTDPRQPRLPLPAHDGGSYLKSIPGFTLSRKGGTSGDPELRGLGGSRLNILVGGTTNLGGCGGRMDPPTAYVFPEAYDSIEVLKGPQSVRHGASAAGVVRFERSEPVFDERPLAGYASTTLGSFGRRDVTFEASAGSRAGYGRVIGTWSEQDDYRAGDGRRVHSQYERWSASGVFGWRPDDHTLVEVGLDRSDAEAAYDDRGMDGSSFDRTGVSLRAVRRDLGRYVEEVEAMLYYNHIDHVMDNFTLREPPGMPMVSYPDRRTRGFRLTSELLPADDTQLAFGVDGLDDTHRANRLMGPSAFEFRQVPRNDSIEFRQYGVFSELSRPAGDQGRFTTGLRLDRSRAEVLAEGGLGGAPEGTVDRSGQTSAFARYSHELAAAPVMLYAGVGRAERAADFWERRRDFDLSSEVLTQFDTGLRYAGDRLSGTLALFYGKLDNYILVSVPGEHAVEARNVDATTVGSELDVSYELSDRVGLVTTLAWVRSDNDTDNVPLAQTPPLEGTLGVDYDDGTWSAGGLLRAVARQDRIHPGHGTIYSLDSGETPGFAVLSIYGGYRFSDSIRLTAGIDNLLDRHYAEHIQQGLAELGAEPSRVPEPGRSMWLRLNGRF
ncbi:TonB-dependent copper receptor [Wenzhouxiangella sp. AB-CW3]|nr:TonB-dependent copper receptor [Wenzhouxiangella sp. AB-CW3]